MKFNKALIIGGSGYLGYSLLKGNIALVTIGTYYQNPKDNLFYFDLLDKNSVENFTSQVQPDLILFAAGLTDVDKCQLNPKLAFQINCESVKTLLNKFHDIKFVYYSTDYVFDGKIGNYNENSIPNPINVYGQSKLEGEKIVLQSNSNNLVIRVSGLYGFTGFKNDRFFTESQKEETIFAEDNRISSPILLKDVVSESKMLLENNENGIFHMGGGVSLSRYEFQQLFSYVSPKYRKVLPSFYTIEKYNAVRPLNTSLISKRLNSFNWESKTPAEGLFNSFINVLKVNRINNQLTDLIDKQKVKAILLDCVGCLLTKREWVEYPEELKNYDLLFGNATNSDEITNELNRKNQFETIVNQISNLYAPNPEMWYMLPYLKQNYKLALVNNGFSITFRIWVKRYGLENIFDVLINSTEIGLKKPSSALFYKIADSLGVSPEECLLIDDLEENIKGALRCGLKALQTFELKKYPICEHSLIKPTQKKEVFPMIFPAKLEKGQVIGVYSPSGSVISAPDETALYEKGVQALINFGYKVKEAKNVRSRFYHMSATAKEKAEDIHSLFLDKEVKAIFPSVGGHTASQILRYLNMDIIRANPKVFVGFSDSALIATYITEKTGMVTFHSAVDVMFGFSRFHTEACPMQNKGEYTTKYFWNMTENGRVYQQPFSQWIGLKEGKATGILIGGNLKGIQALFGTPFEPNWNGKILYWEAKDAPHFVEQVLTHLRNAGVLNKISGMVVGKIAHVKETFYGEDEIMPIHEFIRYILEDIMIPVIVEVDLGHDVENITIPNGCQATICVKNNEIVFNIDYENSL